MNILVVCHYGLYQHPESSFVHAQVKEFSKLGHRVRVLIPVAVGKPLWNQGRWTARPIVADSVELIPVRHISLSNYGKKWLNLAAATRQFKRIFKTTIAPFSPDIIHAHTMGFDSQLGALLKEKLHVPLVVTCHGSDIFNPYREGQIALLKKPCDEADHIVAVSSLLARTVAVSHTTTPISVVLNGFQISNVCPSHHSNPHSIIQVGSLIERKKVHDTIQAFAQVKSRYPDSTLTVVGEGPERENLEKQCRDLGLIDSVRFLGQILNQAALQALAEHKIFVMPSVREGFGIVYLEAMASGCVTIGTQGEGIADFIRHGENGFLVPPDDPDALAKQLLWCLEHPDQAGQVAQQGQHNAMEQTWEKNAQAYTALFQSLIRS